MKERRKHPRIKLAPKFKVKARVKELASSKVHYFEVDNLSLGGMKLLSQVTLNLELGVGHQLEVMLFYKHHSVKVIVEVVEKENMKDAKDLLRAKIVGIDQKAHETLAGFLKKMDESAGALSV